MIEKLEKLIDEDADLRALFASLYVDMYLQRNSVERKTLESSFASSNNRPSFMAAKRTSEKRTYFFS